MQTTIDASRTEENVHTEDDVARVERGAAMLDETDPGWDKRINLSTLDICYPDACVLGQAYNGFYTWYYKHFPQWDRSDPENFEAWLDHSIAHGFTSDSLSSEEFAHLTETWKVYIQARRNAQQQESCKDYAQAL